MLDPLAPALTLSLSFFLSFYSLGPLSLVCFGLAGFGRFCASLVCFVLYRLTATNWPATQCGFVLLSFKNWLAWKSPQYHFTGQPRQSAEALTSHHIMKPHRASPMNYIKGTSLHPQDQKSVLAQFVHRYTGQNIPKWANVPASYKVQFRDDAEWLANTEFAVTKSGRLDRRARYCISHPTWPNGQK